MIPSIGMIVAYRLTMRDAAQINRRRNEATRAMSGIQHAGTVLHTGNAVSAGDVFPFLITKIWDKTPDEASAVNGQVFLDGNDQLWVGSVLQQGQTFDPTVTEGVWFPPPVN